MGYLLVGQVGTELVRVARNYFTPDYVERVGKRIDEAIQALEKKYHLE